MYHGAFLLNLWRLSGKNKKKELMESVSILQECVESFNVCCDLELQLQLWLDTFSDTLFFTEGQIKFVYEQTTEQFDCNERKRQRSGRITTSQFKEIYSWAWYYTTVNQMSIHQPCNINYGLFWLPLALENETWTQLWCTC